VGCADVNCILMRHKLAQQASFRDDAKEKKICAITTGNLSYNLITEVSGWVKCGLDLSSLG